MKRRTPVKLPALELSKFSGKIHEWSEFWDSFCSTVNDNENLADVDKLKYLRGFLEEPARSVIAGIPSTDSSYETAVNFLKSRYANPGVIQRAHINQLLNLAPVFNEKNTARLRSFHDHIETHFRGLEALGVDKITYSSIIVPVLIEKLPEGIRLGMLRDVGKSHLDWNLEEMLGSLSKELEIRECHVPLLRNPNGQGRPEDTRRSRQESNPRRTTMGTANALFAGKEEKKRCAYCSQEHVHEDCPIVATVDDRSTGSGGRVALQTALAKVNENTGSTVRVLFDTGNHKSFITAEAVAKLGLNCLRKETLGIKAFGHREVDRKERDVVEFTLSSLRGGKVTTVTCFVVDEITNIVNVHPEDAKKFYKHLKDVWFADCSRYDRLLDIQVLVGSDFLWEFQEGTCIRGGPNEPAAVKTTLGWVLSGPLSGKCSNYNEDVDTFNSNIVSVEHNEERNLGLEVHKLWDLDTLGIRPQNEVKKPDEKIGEGDRDS
eukprot:gene15555-biopygen13266